MASIQCEYCKHFHYIERGARYLRPEEALRILCPKCLGRHENDVKFGDVLDECDACYLGVTPVFKKTHALDSCCCLRYVDGYRMARLGCPWCRGTGYRVYALNASE